MYTLNRKLFGGFSSRIDLCLPKLIALLVNNFHSSWGTDWTHPWAERKVPITNKHLWILEELLSSEQSFHELLWTLKYI